GVINNDDWEMLLQRLEDCPGEVEKIYERMWARYQGDLKCYKEKAEYYFRLVLFKETSLLHFTICVREELQKIYEESTPCMEESEIVSICEETRAHITIRSSGLLEIAEVVDDGWMGLYYEPSPRAAGNLHRTTCVQFIHRTARDFVIETLKKEYVSSMRQKSDLDLYLDLVPVHTQSRCILWLLDPEAYKRVFLSNEVHENFEMILDDEGVSNAGRIGEVVCESLILMDQTYEKVAKRSKTGWKPFSWGLAHDALGEAVARGLGHYIVPLLADPSRADPTYLTYLLGCATGVSLRASDVGFFRTLLRAGADPMADPASSTSNNVCAGQFFPTAPWYIFLTTLWSKTHTADPDQCDVLVANEITKAFLDYGVDLFQTFALVLLGPTIPTFWLKYGYRLHNIDKALLVMTNAASILRRALAESYWLSISEDYPTLSDVEDCFEVVMLYNKDADDGPWKRLSCVEDSRYLIDQISKISLDAEEDMNEGDMNEEDTDEEDMNDQD
ncbi:MAG: hypothetical protein Q9224_006845, partial [Gallowayella concinna]